MKIILKKVNYIVWLVAIISTLGSLYFSQIMHLTPCILCWYQRILMYPLVLIIAVGILLKDKKLPYYVLPLSLLGASIGLYHNLLYYNIIPESLAPCTLGVSCTTRLIDWFGFLTIPLLSFTAFVLISIGMIISLRNGDK
jgi:disulfide bond formation protein DsbB